MAKQSDIQAFSFDLHPCEHILLLSQPPKPQPVPLHTCQSCDLKANLWLCLTCGNVACGRTQFGATGLTGNGHALAHHRTTTHPIAVKLGSITADGTADVHCYVDDEAISDPALGEHLRVWGIDLTSVRVTERSLAEMQLDLQLNYSFNMSSSEGTPLQPVFGAGLTGLVNLGNSCYVASVIQVPRLPLALPFHGQTYC
jgi:ubiquitin carboxyl-terminal hydrolase 5/13